jgi:hypothetical protein
MSFTTEYPFTLPKGYMDADGTLHKEGVMRLATVTDEILPMRDPRVSQNPAYVPVLVLARVITKLGTVESITPRVIEDLFSTDFNYLLELYNKINETPAGDLPTIGAPRRKVATPP